ncbi:Chromo domain-containing protein 2 [Phlyctema vagabunda]|uniref:Chromo domain-containing protein 2 n=1 Tax=Phlyctema vagabunda TaxID=108571 RepID=A0ABR4PEM2_9HELO
MPPQISEDEASSASDVEMSEPEVQPPPKVASKPPAKAKGRPKKATPVQVEPEPEPEPEPEEEEDEDDEPLKVESEGDDDEDLEEDEYVVEAIKKHLISAETGEILFDVKWEGYEKASDRTWEPEANLMETATDIVLAYLEKHGGREAILEEFNAKNTETATKRKRGRQSNGTGSAKKPKKEISHPRSGSPPASLAEKKFTPPKGNWEEEVVGIDACEGGEGKVVVYLTWQSGDKSQHPLHQVYKRCPQKMLKFYESHLVFKKTESAE